MLGNVESEELRKLMRRCCAANADGTVPQGYFRIDGGRNVKAARQVKASLDWHPDLAKLEDELVELVDDAVQENEFVWVRAIPKGQRHPIKSIKLDGNAELLEDEGGTTPKGAHADKEALAIVALGQMRLIQDQNNRLEQLHDEKLRSMVETGVYRWQTQHPQLGGPDELLQQVARDIGPKLVDQLPQILAILANWQNGAPVAMPAPPAPGPAAAAPEDPDAPDAPEDPIGAFGHHVAVIMASAGELARISRTVDLRTSAQAQAHIVTLRSIVAQVAPFVGMQVVPVQQDQAQRGPATPPPDEPDLPPEPETA